MTNRTGQGILKIKVGVLEDHQMVIDGYQYRLSREADIELVWAAMYGSEIEPLLAKEPVDVLLLDIQVHTAPDNPNPYPILHIIPRVLQLYPELSILVISMLNEQPLVRAIMKAGASGYILKDDRDASRDLGNIVKSVTAGTIYVSPKAEQAVLAQPLDETHSVLTPRQSEILSLCNAYPDLSRQELSQRLNIEYSTVRNTLSDAYFRLGVRSLSAALAKARQLGILTP